MRPRGQAGSVCAGLKYRHIEKGMEIGLENVTEELYKRFQENFVDTAKDNPFYKYYYNLLDTGTVYSKFFNRKLLKEIDEEWVTAIETALPHIQYVIDHPRTFIEEDRQIVSVAVAKSLRWNPSVIWRSIRRWLTE